VRCDPSAASAPSVPSPGAVSGGATREWRRYPSRTTRRATGACERVYRLGIVPSSLASPCPCPRVLARLQVAAPAASGACGGVARFRRASACFSFVRRYACHRPFPGCPCCCSGPLRRLRLRRPVCCSLLLALCGELRIVFFFSSFFSPAVSVPVCCDRLLTFRPALRVLCFPLLVLRLPVAPSVLADALPRGFGPLTPLPPPDPPSAVVAENVILCATLGPHRRPSCRRHCALGALSG
jgi:hypothetical protein